MEETSLQGPVLMVNGKLTLMIPLEDGGAELADCSRGISEVAGDEGDIVPVSNWDGKLRIEPNAPKVVQ